MGVSRVARPRPGCLQLFGEAVAIGLLQEMSLDFNEDDAFFELTRFDGQKIRIFDGKVVPVV